MAADSCPVKEEDASVTAVGWPFHLVVHSTYYGLPIAGVWLGWWCVRVLRRDEVYSMRRFILIEYGDVDVHLGCDGVHNRYGGLEVVAGAVPKDGVDMGAPCGVARQLWSYALVLGLEALWVQWVGWVAQHWALQHGRNVVCRGSSAWWQAGFPCQGLPSPPVLSSSTIS